MTKQMTCLRILRISPTQSNKLQVQQMKMRGMSTGCYKHPPPRRMQKHYLKKLTEQQKEVFDLYNDDEVSYSLPDSKYAGLRFMSMTLKEAYFTQYLLKAKEERKMSLASFCSLKPQNFRTIQQIPLRGCKCDYCQSLGIVREKLIGIGFKGIPKNHACSIEATWCSFCSVSKCSNTSLKYISKLASIPEDHYENSYGNYSENHDVKSDGNNKPDCSSFHTFDHPDELPQKKCVMRKCSDCGVEKYRRIVEQNNSELLQSTDKIQWKQWKNITYTKNEEEKHKMGDDIETGTNQTLFNSYMQQLQEMSLHQFNKVWQLKQLKSAINSLKVGKVLIVHDFSQNLLLYDQDEPQGRHWDHEQVTIHPSVAYYKWSTHEEVIKEEMIHITEDRKHDHTAVQAFMEKCIEHLRGKGVQIDEIIEFSDQAASQYKNKSTFYHLTKSKIPVAWHYYAVRHDKSSADRAGGNFKSFLGNLVKAGQVSISSCEDIIEISRSKYEKQQCCTEDQEEHSLRIVFYHPEIPREGKLPKLKRVIDTREIHSIRNTGIEGVLEIRLMSCCCCGCFHNGPCLFPEYSDPWKMVSVTTHKKKDLEKLRNTIHIYKEPTTLDTESNMEIMESVMETEPVDIPNSVMESCPLVDMKTSVHIMESDMKSPKPSPEVENNYDWKVLLDFWSTLQSYKEFEKEIRSFKPCPIQINVEMEMCTCHKIDEVAWNFSPSDGPKDMYPIQTYVDGNCFPHAISKLDFGEETSHYEIHARIIVAGIVNEDKLTRDSILSRGEKNERSNSLSVQYVMYSGINMTGTGRINRDEVIEVYHKELMALAQMGTYMGMWQFHQYAEVIH